MHTGVSDMAHAWMPEFDAIHIVDGIAVVDKEACKACGKCVDACPKHLIELIPCQAENICAV